METPSRRALIYRDFRDLPAEVRPGATLQDLPSDALQASLEPTARTLRGIASTDVHDTTGFGSFDGTGHGHFPTWKSWLTSELHSLRSLGQPGVAGVVDQFQLLIGSCEERRSLVHGDFGANNVLWDGHEISGVLDWENAMIGDPLYDRANIYFWDPWLECMSALAKHLSSFDQGERDSDACVAYQLRIGLHEVLWNRGRDQAMSDWALRRCHDISLAHVHAGQR